MTYSFQDSLVVSTHETPDLVDTMTHLHCRRMSHNGTLSVPSWQLLQAAEIRRKLFTMLKRHLLGVSLLLC